MFGLLIRHFLRNQEDKSEFAKFKHDPQSIREDRIFDVRFSIGGIAFFKARQTYLRLYMITWKRIIFNVKLQISEHLKCLKSSLVGYFPKLDESFHWIQNPFSQEKFQSPQLDVAHKESLIEISTASPLKSDFKQNYWLDLDSEYEHDWPAMKILLPFQSTVLLEKLFHPTLALKTNTSWMLPQIWDCTWFLSSPS